MLNHRHKRILIPVLFVKEMNFVRLDAPSGGQNRWEFPKGINPRTKMRVGQIRESFSSFSSGRSLVVNSQTW